MSRVEHVSIEPDEADQRLERWFRRRYPHLSQGRIEKMLRKGEVRVDGARAKAADRIYAGMVIRVPPIPEPTPQEPAFRAMQESDVVSASDEEFIRSLVLYEDDHVIALNKPAGLAVQGGSGQRRHIDGMLPALAKRGRKAPRLVHRLDLETSGVLLVGRTVPATAALAASFRHRQAKKTYWAVTFGVPRPRKGSIRFGVTKEAWTEKMKTVDPGDVESTEGARRALTDYAVIESLGSRCAWVALRPVTGRTHQLRVHMASIGCPIVGDGKYGEEPWLGGDFSRKLHLHARSLTVAHPSGDGSMLNVTAPLPAHIERSFAMLSWDPMSEDAADPFEELDRSLGKR